MNKRKTISLFLLLFISGCFNLDFVYEAPKFIDDISEKTLLSVDGDDDHIISAYIVGQLKTPNNDPDYLLSVNSVKSITASVIEIDATASKFDVKYEISYNLKNIKKGCLIIKENIKTRVSYNSKSAGYSFGTDVSKKEISTKAIHSNINKFLENLNTSKLNLDCENES